MMKQLSCALIIFAFASNAWADCNAEIQALFNGGAWDPFVRENREETVVTQKPDGSEQSSYVVLWDGPLKSINCTPNGCIMAIGFSSWLGSSNDGPWTPSNDTGTGDPEEFVRGTSDRLAKSISEPECLGEVELDGRTAQQYRFFSKPEPNEFGAWWGGQYTVWVDQPANQLLRIELAEGIASWAPEPTDNIQVTTIIYDKSISIEQPNL